MTTVHFATNRNPVPNSENPTDFGKGFSMNGLSDLRFGWAEVEGDEVKSLHTAEETADGQKIGSLTLFEAVKAEMANSQKDTIIFIHGYNTSFHNALTTAAHTKENFDNGGHPVNIVVFTWPSDGQAIPWKSYINDRHDAEASALAFARGILKLADFLKTGIACGQEMHLLCHSMGNYALRNSIQAMLNMQSSLPRLFQNIFLMAADEDDDAMEVEHKLLPIIHLTKEVYIYFNRGDLALKGSDWTKGNPDRLGSNGPRYPLNLANKVTLVDCTNVVDERVGLGHSYFHEDKTVVADMLAVLSGMEDDQIPNRTYDQRKNKYVLSKPLKP